MGAVQGATKSPQIPGTSTRLPFGVMFLLLAIVLPLLHLNSGIPSPGASAAVIQAQARAPSADVVARQSDDICVRWSQQSAMVNGTLYLYGGQASTQPQQEVDTWNNDFLSIDLSKSWPISQPSASPSTNPDGPPPVANGYLWASYDSLFLYGGIFSKMPVTPPTRFSGWEYDIASSSWKEQSNPMTSSGTNAPSDGQPVQRSGEGAGFSVASLGKGWYFGGHQDPYTTAGWSVEIPKIFLKSLLEYTFPGSKNSQVQSLSGGQTAPSAGAWRNVTGGGSQTEAGFPERADGVLVYIPAYGAQGILVGLAGGENSTFTQLNVIDVFDIATSTWYKQATTGETPKVRVNACAVVAAAQDGSSYQIHLYGGQNLTPYQQQIQYDDMWILSVPSFQWIEVDTSGQSTPAARAGQTCNVMDGQMVVVGGYVGTQLSCDSPGTYVFDLSKLQWVNQFTSTSDRKSNPHSIQHAQLQNPKALPGSYGYEVPAVVQSQIGGAASGGATITKPIATATGGPLATGSAVTYTVTGANGAVATETGYASPNDTSSGSDHKTEIIAIVVGVVAGILLVVAIYMGICAWLYRKRLRLYQDHMEAERAARGDGAALFPNSTSDKPNSSSGYGSDPTPMESSTARSSTDDLLRGQEPTFVGIMLHPRRSLKTAYPENISSPMPQPTSPQSYTLPKPLHPPTPYVTHTLRSTSNLLHLFHARNRNQHRRAIWYRHLGGFRREVRRLAEELDVAVHGSKGASAVGRGKGTKRPKSEDVRGKIERRLGFWRDAGLVGRWYRAFTHLVATTQFSAQGLVLLALLARVSSITGLTKWYQQLAEREDEERQEAVRRVLHEFGEKEMSGLMRGSKGDEEAGSGDGTEEDLGEVIMRDEG
ncbi:MAG: hypothetical protein M1828_006358 [Chrysothrix sp. TS-e1954]|nr:MAG: hypothetical protein M1828_006358 [Chrysothrix sp. TS-e1954]